MLDPRLSELRAIVEGATCEALPGLIGELEAAKAAAWHRMILDSGASHEGSVRAQDQNLSVKEAARRLSVSPRYLYSHADEYPFTRRIGRRVLFSKRGLERWCREGRSL